MVHQIALKAFKRAPRIRRHHLWRLVAVVWAASSLQILSAGVAVPALPTASPVAVELAGAADQWLAPEAGDEQDRECRDAPQCLLSAKVKSNPASALCIDVCTAEPRLAATLRHSGGPVSHACRCCVRCNTARGPPHSVASVIA